jgi:calcium-dependent protein kinase
MPRVDVWDLPTARAPGAPPPPPLDCGFRRGLEAEYAFVPSTPDLGQGGFGRVRLATNRATGEEVAVKSIAKRLDLPGVAPQQQQRHLDNIRREVAVLRRLRGCLNVVRLVDAFEDDEDAHIVMECCRGGELVHRIGARAYTEKTVRGGGTVGRLHALAARAPFSTQLTHQPPNTPPQKNPPLS